MESGIMLGDSVWFYPNDTSTRAAVVNFIVDEKKKVVHLTVFNPSGVTERMDVPFSDKPQAGHWSFRG